MKFLHLSLKLGEFAIKINIILLAVLIFSAFAGILQQSIIVLISIILHEFCHIAIAMLSGGKLISIKIMPFGMNAEINLESCSFKSLIFIYSSGPLFNLLLSLASFSAFIFSEYNSDFFYLFYSTNLYLAAFNLIPAYPLDGSRIIIEILKEKFGIALSFKYLGYVSIFLSLILITYGIFSFFLANVNVSLLLIGIYMLLFLKINKSEAPFMNMKQLIYRRTKVIKKGVYPCRELVVIKQKRMIEILGNMDYNCFHVIHILDECMKLQKTVTECEIIQVLLEDVNATFEVFCKAAEDSFKDGCV